MTSCADCIVPCYQCPANATASPPQCELESRDYPHVPDGDYDACVISAETWDRRSGKGWGPRLCVRWRLVEPGHMGIVIHAWYRLRRVDGRRRYLVAARARLQMDLAVMLGRRPPTDRYPLDHVRTHVYRVRTRTVTTMSADYGMPTELPAAMRYSVVHCVVGMVA
jgi:hypothetical protein